MNGIVRPLVEADLPHAQRVCRVAFGTFLRAPDPEKFWSDLDYVYGRWRAPHVGAFGAELDGRLVGSNFATCWGSVGFFGPLSVEPDKWDRGLAKPLVEAATAHLDRSGVTHAGLFTFADSAKHLALYQKFGYWARALTAIMSKPVEPGAAEPGAVRYSALSEAERSASLDECRQLADAVHEGLDLTEEIRAVQAQGLGETLLLRSRTGDRLAGFAICHYGPASEAGAGMCFVKFAAVRPDADAAGNFDRLLRACDALARTAGLPRVLAGANMARHEAYRHLIAAGFRTLIQGVAMQRPNEPGYNRQGVYIIDDWR